MSLTGCRCQLGYHIALSACMCIPAPPPSPGCQTHLGELLEAALDVKHRLLAADDVVDDAILLGLQRGHVPAARRKERYHFAACRMAEHTLLQHSAMPQTRLCSCCVALPDLAVVLSFARH